MKAIRGAFGEVSWGSRNPLGTPNHHSLAAQIYRKCKGIEQSSIVGKLLKKALRENNIE